MPFIPSLYSNRLIIFPIAWQLKSRNLVKSTSTRVYFGKRNFEDSSATSPWHFETAVLWGIQRHTRNHSLWVFLSRKTKIASKRSRHRQTYAILAGALKIPGTCWKKWQMTFVSCRGRDRGFGHRRNMYPVCHVLVTLNHRKRELTLSLSLSGRFSFSCVEKLLSVVNNEIVYWISQWNLGNANFKEKVRIFELWRSCLTVFFEE